MHHNIVCYGSATQIIQYTHLYLHTFDDENKCLEINQTRTFCSKLENVFCKIEFD